MEQAPKLEGAGACNNKGLTNRIQGSKVISIKPDTVRQPEPLTFILAIRTSIVNKKRKRGEKSEDQIQQAITAEESDKP